METVAKKQADSLFELKNEVTIQTCRHDRSLPLLENSESGYEIKRWRSLNFLEKRFGVTFPLISPLHFFKILYQINHFDLIHIHDVFYMSSQLMGFAAILKNKPFYITQHVALVEHPNKLIMTIQKIIYKTIGRLIFNKAQTIIVYNSNVKNFLISLGVNPAKIFQTLNGIDTDVFKPANKNEKLKLKKKYNIELKKPVILFVGRLVPKKGFDLVFKLRSKSYQTIIVGSGRVPKRMQNGQDVIFFGQASETDLIDLYRLSDIFVFPSIGEIFTLVIQEAMACGMPIVTTDDKAYFHYELERDLIGFTEREFKALKLKIDTILNDSTKRKLMGAYSRKLAIEKFSWKSNYIKELNLYKRLAS